MELKCNFSHQSVSHNLLRRDSPQLPHCFVCTASFKGDEDTYYCSSCNKESHLGCYEFPREIREHPYHPSHTLTLINLSDFKSSIPHSWPDDKVPSHDPNENLEGCTCCRRKLQDMYYNCSECNFSLNATCAMDPPPLTILSTKRHGKTTFTLFPRRISLPCDDCGEPLNKGNDHVYTCLSRNYIAHGKCIMHLPIVIRITRHAHRLNHNNSLPPSGGSSCGVCHKTVNVNYGKYSCMKDCHYAVHSKCATREDVWDGEDLDGKDKKDEEDEDPFEKIDEETIQHFSHVHHKLKFYEDNKDLRGKFCQACLLRVVDYESLYSCEECDFILHKSCASLPRRIDHPLHKHRLTLLPFPTNLYLVQFMVFVENMFKCSGCHQRGCGFMYQCQEKGCRFQLDARCASLSEPINHGCHVDSFYLKLTKGKCVRCGSNKCSPSYLESSEGKFFLGLKCATLPHVAYYKYDSHPLNLCYGEKYHTTSSGRYWCEKCEQELDAKKWFYTCESCCVTLHVTCLLGKEVYMKPDHTIKVNDYEVKIVPNNCNPRPFCHTCGHLCVDTLVFKRIDRHCCTLDCMKKLLDREKREGEQKEEGEEVMMTSDLLEY